MRPPRVTAIVPCYNGAAFVQDMLDSLAAQTWPDLEILIGDDASSDATPEILRRFASGRDNVRLHLRDANLGWSANTNDLMARATGAFLFYAQHDDSAAPRYVEKLVTPLLADPGAVLAFCDMLQREPNGSEAVLSYDPTGGAAHPRGRAMGILQWNGPWHVPYRGVFRAAAFARIGGLKPHARGEYAADLPWLVHMAILGRFVHVPEVLYFKTYLPTSLSKVWRFGPDVKAAVYHSAEREVFASDLDPVSKLRLAAWIRRRTTVSQVYRATLGRLRTSA